MDTTGTTSRDARDASRNQLLELLDWIARAPRTYRETIETWGSHCPRLTPWEDAQQAGLVQVTSNGGVDGRLTVVLSGRGRAALDARHVG